MYGYSTFYQRVEADAYGGTWELLKEGFMTSFALFLVSPTSFSPLSEYVHDTVTISQVNWIIVYTALNHG